jgi:hypothetical protein
MKEALRKRIEKRLSEGPVVIVPGNEHRDPRVFGLEEYLKMKELPKTVKPHTYRKAARKQADPLGAVVGRVLSRLSRNEIYE